MKYFVFYDKHGAFLGGLMKKSKPAKKGYKEVSKEEYVKIMGENGITVTFPEETKEPEQLEMNLETPTEEA